MLGVAAQLVARGVAFALITVVRRTAPTSGKPGDKAILTEEGEWLGWVGGSCAEPVARKAAAAALRDGQCRLIRVTNEEGDERPGIEVTRMSCYSGGSLELYVEPHLAAPKLVVFGHSPIAEALSELGRALDHQVTAVNLRERRLETVAEPARSAAVVVASHGHFEVEALEWALSRNVAYVGLVTSRRRWTEVSGKLAARGLGPQIARVHAPAGLDIGAAEPKEVALSVLSEIVSVRRGGMRRGAGVEREVGVEREIGVEREVGVERGAGVEPKAVVEREAGLGGEVEGGVGEGAASTYASEAGAGAAAAVAPAVGALTASAAATGVAAGAAVARAAGAVSASAPAAAGAPAGVGLSSCCCAEPAVERAAAGGFSAVVLAAGLSRRMGGRNKLLLPVDGVPMIVRVVEAVKGAGPDALCVVLGHEAAEVGRVLEPLGVRTVFNPDFASGQVSSVRTGLAALGQLSGPLMICLGDQPLLTSDDLRRLSTAFEERPHGSIVVPMCGASRGNPVMMDAASAAETLERGTHFGCRHFMDEHPERVYFWQSGSEHFIRDVDQPADYQPLSAASGS